MKSGCGTTPPPTHTFTKMSYRGRPSQRGFYRTPRDRNGFPGRGATPFTQPLLESADSTNDQVLRLRLQSQVLLGRALEMENRRFQEEITNLRECMRNNNQPDGGVTPHPNGTHRSRSLADRIDGGQHQSPRTSCRTTAAERQSLGKIHPSHPQSWSAQWTFTHDSSLSGPIFKRGGRGDRCSPDRRTGRTPSAKTQQYDPAGSDVGVHNWSIWTTCTFTSTSVRSSTAETNHLDVTTPSTHSARGRQSKRPSSGEPLQSFSNQGYSVGYTRNSPLINELHTGNHS